METLNPETNPEVFAPGYVHNHPVKPPIKTTFYVARKEDLQKAMLEEYQMPACAVYSDMKSVHTKLLGRVVLVSFVNDDLYLVKTSNMKPGQTINVIVI